jgi:hypothetical protein
MTYRAGKALSRTIHGGAISVLFVAKPCPAVIMRPGFLIARARFAARLRSLL